jgi:hypothetical protein
MIAICSHWRRIVQARFAVSRRARADAAALPLRRISQPNWMLSGKPFREPWLCGRSFPCHRLTSASRKLNLSGIWARFLVGNTASARVMEKAGMMKEGVLPERA